MNTFCSCPSTKTGIPEITENFTSDDLAEELTKQCSGSALPQARGHEATSLTPEQRCSKSRSVPTPLIPFTFLQHTFPLKQPVPHVSCIAKSYLEKGPTPGLQANDLRNNNIFKKMLHELNLFQRLLHQRRFVQVTFDNN